jgi:hypothetical protein
VPLDDARVVAIRDRWALREGLRALSSMTRVARCGVHRLDGRQASVRTDATGRASFGGLETCGSIWACPNCSARIRQQRAVELGDAGTVWQRDGGALEFVSLTVGHGRDDALESTLGDVHEAWRRLQQSVIWRDLRESGYLSGFVRATEITRREMNGWHPHLHVALFVNSKLTGDERQALRDRIAERWAAILRRMGRRSSLKYGVDWRPAFMSGAEGLAWYLCKVQDELGHSRPLGQEMVRGDLKRGRLGSRTPFEILASAVADRRSMAFVRSGVAYARSDVGLWHEYEQATKGHQAIAWSKGLRALVGAVEVADEELAAVEAPLLCWTFWPDDWRMVVRLGLRGDVLVAAEAGGADGVARYLRRVRDGAKRGRYPDRPRFGVDIATGEIL